jgi:hypothetical protein
MLSSRDQHPSSSSTSSQNLATTDPATLEQTLAGIIKAVDAGVSASDIERTVPGVRVTRLRDKTEEEELFENLRDPGVRARLTDPVDLEEVTLMMQLNQEMRKARDSLRQSESAVVAAATTGRGIDQALVSEIQAEVAAAGAGAGLVAGRSLLEEMERIESSAEGISPSSVAEPVVSIATATDPIDIDRVLSSARSGSPGPKADNKEEFASLLREAIAEGVTEGVTDRYERLGYVLGYNIQMQHVYSYCE